MRRPVLVGLFCFVLLGSAVHRSATLGAQVPAVPSQVLHYADMVLYNGKVLTADDKFTIHQAVAVRDGKFLAVGRTPDMLALAGPTTQKIDLQGRTVVPGLFDTHLHQAWVGQVAKGESAGSTTTSSRRGKVVFKDVASGLEEVRAILAKEKPGAWIYLNGPDNDALILKVTLQQMDEAAPANPIAITTTNNLARVNSLALQSLDQTLGGIEKDPKTGKPTGIVSGFALGELTYDRMPVAPLSQQAVDLQEQVFKKLNSEGLTTIVGRAQGTSVSVLKQLWEQDRLTTRVRIAHEFLRQNGHAENYLKRLGNLAGFGDDRMKIIGATLQPADGTGTSGAMFTKEPKRHMLVDDPFGPNGQNKFQNYGNTLETSEYHNIILANRYGWNVLSVHSQGDGASAMLLQAFEEANKERPLKGAWGFDHALSRTPENIRQAVKLGVIFSISSKYLFQGTPDALVSQYGEAVYKMTPVRDMIDAGMKPVGESDITGKYSSPLWNMAALITRTDEKGKIWNAKEAITRQEALWMKTNWASRYTADDKILGTIEAGKLADLVVLGDDYMTVPEKLIKDIPIDLTIVGGKVMYDRKKEGVIKCDYWEQVRMSDSGN